MKQQASSIFLGLIRGCLGANGQGSDWKESIDTGKAALEQHRSAQAERAFPETLTAASRFGEQDARFSGALLFLAETSDVYNRGETRRSGEHFSSVGCR